MVSQVPIASEHLGLDDLKVVALECDVSLEESVAEAFARTLGAFGRVDAVVASAGRFSLSCQPPVMTEVTRDRRKLPRPRVRPHSRSSPFENPFTLRAR